MGVVITLNEGVREVWGDNPSDCDVSSICLEADLLLCKGRATFGRRVLAFGFTTATRRLGDLRLTASPLCSRAVTMAPSSPGRGVFGLLGHPDACV